MIPVMRPWLGAEEAAAAAEAVRSGWVAQGPRVAEFERAFAAAVGASHGVAVSSCTTALHLALVIAGIRPNDEVVVPSLSFIATANAPRYVGAVPVFADVEETTQNLTPATVQPCLTARTRAVILVDQAGVPADIDAIRSLCEPRGITVIQDAACAAGSTYRGQPVGSRADLAAFSFHPRKLLTTGEGGMLVTSSSEIAARARRLREHGMDVSAAARHVSNRPVVERYLELGFNFRMTDIQAAVGLVQLEKLNDLIARRRLQAQRYQQLLAEIPDVRTVTDPEYGTTNFQSFWIEVLDDFPISRDELIELLAENGVSARRGIMAAHLEPAYEAFPRRALPVTERLTARTLILPLFHELSEAEQASVVAVIAAARRRERRARVSDQEESSRGRNRTREKVRSRQG
jgi:perosamine synthetase